MTYSRFLELFPGNDACLAYLKDKFFPDGSECPKCGRATRFHKLTGRSAYSCQYCRHQVYPTAGTIFHKSSVSLQFWFYAIYLMSSTRCGISAKQLEREIGVTYKTAHRMFKQIRTLLGQDDTQLSGEVEMDETWVGGKVYNHNHLMTHSQAVRKGMANKTIVFGAVERGGQVRTRIVPNRGQRTLTNVAREFVLPSAMVFTDEWHTYGVVGEQYRSHRRVSHKARVYVDGTAHTNTIEGFWSLLKNGLRGVYHAVSATYLQSYVDEYSFRYNRRFSDQPLFYAMLDRVERGRLATR